jgi:hypothetical protein
MKCLIVHETDKGFIGEEVEYKRSGSGFYRETSSRTIPQNRDEITKFATENGYSIEWRKLQPAPASA